MLSNVDVHFKQIVLLKESAFSYVTLHQHYANYIPRSITRKSRGFNGAEQFYHKVLFHNLQQDVGLQFLKVRLSRCTCFTTYTSNAAMKDLKNWHCKIGLSYIVLKPSFVYGGTCAYLFISCARDCRHQLLSLDHEVIKSCARETQLSLTFNMKW
jgi:hypothetical protein